MSDERAVNKDAEAIVICIAPDVCLTPVGGSMVQVPYTITSKFDVAVDTAPEVNYAGLPAFTMASRLPTVKGDELGTGGGIFSGVNLGYCRPVEHSGTVRAHKQYVIRHNDLMHMNCNGPEGPGNTYGRIVYIDAGPAGDVEQETLSKEATVTTTPDGKTVVEERSVTRDPATGEVTQSVQQTTIDPKTGAIQTQSASVTTNPLTGDRTYNAMRGSFDPSTDAYSMNTWSSTVPGNGPPPIEGGLSFGDGPVLGDDAIGTVGQDGRVYLGDGVYGDPSTAVPAGDVGDIADNDPELLADPDYQAALAEETAAQAEIDAVNDELAWEAAKTAADLAGLVDPTPISDTLGAGLALADGDFVGAGLSLVSWIPYLGDAVAKPFKGTRAAAKTARLLEKLKGLLAKMEKIKDSIKRAKDKIKDLLKRKRGKPPEPPEPPKPPKPPGDGEQVPDPKKRYEEMRRKAKEQERLKALREKRLKAEAKGKNKQPYVSKEEEDWLAANERNRDLAYDPATDSFKVDEAQAALKAEQEGLLSGVTRGSNPSGLEGGADFIDGAGKAWDAKSAVDLDAIRNALASGENVLVHGSQAAIDAVRSTLGAASDRLIYVVTKGGP